MRALPTPYRMFWIDGLGAVLSALLLLILAAWQEVFGMPRTVLFTLMPFVLAFAAFSLSCALFRPERWKPMLAGIAAANLLYACVTLVLVIVYRAQLSLLGKTAFIAEIVVILLVVGVEWRVLRHG